MKKMEKLLVSFIIPVYNAELYLSQCLDSILGQTYFNIEVILVDDGSIDKSGWICDEYARRDKRIKVIHKKNGGAAQARNIGIQRAKGAYIIFMDSDDFWTEDNHLQALMEYKDRVENFDILFFNLYYFYPSCNKLKSWPKFSDKILQCTDPAEVVELLVADGVFPVSPCSKIIRRDFLIKNEVYFPEGMVGEDIPWFIYLLNKATVVRFVNRYVYAYRKEVVSSVSSTFSEKKYEDIFKILKDEVKKINLIPELDLRNALLSFMAYEYCILMGMVNNFPVQVRKYEIRKLKEYYWLLQYDLNPKVRKVKLLLRFSGAYLSRWALFFYIKKVVNRN